MINAGQVTWPLIVETISQSDAESRLPAGVQLMLTGVKLSTMLVAVVINNGKSLYNNVAVSSDDGTHTILIEPISVLLVRTRRAM